MPRTLFALAFFFILCVSAFASPCPRVLACGCNLAEHLGIEGKLKRKLWVARNWLTVGSRAERGCRDCIVVLSRGRRGGHVGIVRRYDANGNPVVYSWGNRRVRWFTKTYPKSRVLGYRYMNTRLTNIEFAQ